MGPDEARAFVASNHRAVLVTRRPGGGLQTSPVLVGVDDEGKVVISTREGAYKTRNLRHNPTVVLCVLSDNFFGRWIQIQGTAQVVSLPEAMEGPVDYYRRISGEHPDWDDYRRAMQRERRVLVRVSIDGAGPAPSLASPGPVLVGSAGGGLPATPSIGGAPMASEDFPAPSEGFVVTHFIVAADVARSRDFYTGVLGGRVVLDGEPTIVKLANGWVIINVGGGPTDDKPEVVLEPPTDPTRTSAFLNLRVADIQTTYREWRSRGAEFLTPPKVHSREIRCYMRDPDGHLIEVGQTTGGPT